VPRELADVLHHFFPEQEHGAPPDADAAPALPGAAALPGTAALPIAAVPLEGEDAVGAALLWNLGVEVARHGGRCVLLRPEGDAPDAAWPPAGRQPLGAELVTCRARDLGALYRVAVELAVRQGGAAGIVLVQVPPAWIAAPGDGAALLDWTLLLTTCVGADLRTTYALARRLVAARPTVRLGVTIHDAPSRRAAEAAVGSLARVVRSRLGRDLTSYGLLVDDLHVYRLVAAERPIGLTHPQSLAARALHDVAGLLLEDARDLEPDG